MCYLMIGSECEKGVTQPVFGLLQDVLHRENSPESDIIFVCQPKRTVLFCTHFAAYQIECIPNAYQCFLYLHSNVIICLTLCPLITTTM